MNLISAKPFVGPSSPAQQGNHLSDFCHGRAVTCSCSQPSKKNAVAVGRLPRRRRGCTRSEMPAFASADPRAGHLRGRHRRQRAEQSCCAASPAARRSACASPQVRARFAPLFPALRSAVLPIAFAPGFGFQGREMLVGPTKLLLVDEISTGLDSSATFRILKCIQQILHLVEATAVASEGQVVYRQPNPR